jgi:peptidase inhibitor I9
MWGKTRGLLLVASAIALVAAIPSTASANGPSVDPGPAGPARDVIVVLRNQHTNLPSGKGTNSARAQANRADQASAFSFARAHGVKQLHGFNAVNEFAATVTPAQQQALAADPAVAAVFPDLAIKAAPIVTDDATTTKNGARPNTVVPPTSGTICPSDPAQPQLEPEALQVTNTAFQNTSTPQAQNIVNGTGVKVAFIADGLDVNNPDFIRANGQHVFVDYKDFSGDGPNAPTGAADGRRRSVR